MSDINNEIERFARDLAANEGLRNEVKAIGNDNAAVVKLANAKGYNFTLDDVEALDIGEGELSDLQLDLVAGGAGGIFVDKKGGNVFIWWG
jgi:predicted ribosomally synthesized peptide with nif11-like leader